VTFKIGRRALSYWDVRTSRWRIALGCYRVMVGRSSRQIAQRTSFSIGKKSCARR
jgi:beta-glucosidase